MAKRAAWTTFILMGGVSLYNLGLRPEYADRWLTAPEIYFAAPVPILTGIIALALLRALSVERHSNPFWLSFTPLFFVIAGLGVMMCPHVFLQSLTFSTASPPIPTHVF